LVMISSGIRVSFWNYLNWGDFTPIHNNGRLVAAKLKVFNTKTKNYYYSYVTPEAYEFVKNEWLLENHLVKKSVPILALFVTSGK
jgi:hypothetical protein